LTNTKLKSSKHKIGLSGNTEATFGRIPIAGTPTTPVAICVRRTKMITNETPEEREEFNRVERESKAKQESIRGIKLPTREQLMAEVAVLTELVRVLSDRVAELEKNT
jgi:hypothetical protein